MGGTNIEPGRYKITNRKGGTALDLSGGDNKSIIGFEAHGQQNQQWDISEPDGEDNQTIQSVSSGKFLTLDAGSPGDGVHIIAGDEPRKWAIRHNGDDHAHWRVFYPGTSFNFDLADHGSATFGTPIQLWGCWEGENQQWIFEKVN